MPTVQAEKTAVLEASKCMTLLRNMIRIGVSSICHMRSLFPPGCYKTVTYGDSRMHIHTLQAQEKDAAGNVVGINEDVLKLTNWLEQGVFVALEKGYIDTMTFYINAKDPETDEEKIYEQYSFKLVDSDGSTDLKINNSTYKMKTKDGLKKQATKFLRQLIEFGFTLEDIPETCWISLSLTYTDIVDPDYEPEHFVSGSFDTLKFFRMPIKVKLGNITTAAQTMSLSFAGVETMDPDDLLDSEHKLKGLSLQETLPSSKAIKNESRADTPATVQGPRKVDTCDEETCDMNEEEALRMLQDAPRAAPEFTEASGAEHTLESQPTLPPNYRAIRDYVVDHKKSCGHKKCASALGLPEQEVREVFEDMLRNGLLQKKGHRYSVAAIADSETQETQEITPVSMEPNTSRAPPAAPRKPHAAGGPPMHVSRLSPQELADREEFDDIEGSYEDDVGECINMEPIGRQRGSGGTKHGKLDFVSQPTSSGKGKKASAKPEAHLGSLSGSLQTAQAADILTTMSIGANTSAGTDTSHGQTRKEKRVRVDSQCADDDGFPPLSQTSMTSQASERSESRPRKARKTSIISDPLKLQTFSCANA